MAQWEWQTTGSWDWSRTGALSESNYECQVVIGPFS